ncbi:MAG: hypothetical protein CMI09_01840 [Oceanospirillaceae bacterium]|nr:hypothetical protein [Oceanospirillaceae bacterium]|tara:strand:+ start:163 stop:426 length:264 start_codon:yes stop_codon:yes gene_type:complete
MKAWLLTGILAFISTAVLAEQPPAIKLEGVAHLEPGSKMYRKVDKSEYEIGDVVKLQDEKSDSVTRKARILRVGNKSVVLEVLATTE